MSIAVGCFQMSVSIASCEGLHLHSAAMSNGLVVAAMLEEISELPIATKTSFAYSTHLIDSSNAKTGLPVSPEVSPHGSVPVLVDTIPYRPVPITITDAGPILLYLAEKYAAFIPGIASSPMQYADTLKWVFWGCAALSGSSGKDRSYLIQSIDLATSELSMQTSKNLLQVLEVQLQHQKNWIVGDEFTIADICVWPWLHNITTASADKDVFSLFKHYPFIKSWYARCLCRPATQRSLIVLAPRQKALPLEDNSCWVAKLKSLK